MVKYADQKLISLIKGKIPGFADPGYSIFTNVQDGQYKLSERYKKIRRHG
jgi:hypothetical protein